MADLLVNDQIEALNQLDTYLCDNHSAVKLVRRQLNVYRVIKPLAGWRLSLDTHSVDLVVPPGYPYSSPYLYLQGQSKVLKWPHIEKNNRLCVLPGHVTFDVMDPISVATYILSEAQILINELSSGLRKEDFVSEFDSYWGMDIKTGQRDIVNLLTVNPYSREISWWPGSRRVYIADSAEEGSVWLQHYMGDKYKASEFKKGLFMWLPDGISPPYPCNADEVNQLAVNVGADEILNNLLREAPERVLIAFGFPSGTGIALGGIWVRRPVNTSIPGRARDNLTDGFRPDKMSEGVLYTRYLSGTPVDRTTVIRADPEWVHGRGGAGYDKDLAVKQIVMIGCGSVGSGVIELLVQTGLINITIIDPEILKWDNVGRHKLGGKKSLHKYKALSMKTELEQRFPHVNINVHTEKWEKIWSEAPDVFTKADVVVSTIGEWAAEAALNRLARSTLDFPDLVFGWTEAQAIAAHALVVCDLGGCLCCGMSDTGIFTDIAVKWENEMQMVQTPACGGYYQPYGAIDLAPSHHLISTAIVDLLKCNIIKSEHRVWFGDAERVKALGGVWGDNWTAASDDPQQGLRIIKRSWAASCNQCKGGQ